MSLATGKVEAAEAPVRGRTPWLEVSALMVGLAMTQMLLSAGVTAATMGLLAGVVALTVAVVVTARSDEPSGGWAAIALGILGITTGLGIGIRWLMVDGISWTAALHLAALMGGCVLTVAGVRRLTTERSGVVKAIVASVWFLVVAFLVWNLAPAVVATNVPPIGGTSLPADWDLETESVQYSTSDGVELFAWYIPPDPNGRTVVLRHGSGSTSVSVLPQAAVLARNGFGVLVTDARGHGRSTGRAMDFGWYGED
jgi:hypothetical protein